MKKIIVALLIFTLVFSLTCCKNASNNTDNGTEKSETGIPLTEDNSPETHIVGGWTEQEGEISKELADIFNKATENITDLIYTPEKLISTQVVAGMNYKFLCCVALPDGTAINKMTVVTVYQDLSGNATVTSVEDYVG